jgi:hypothetical protein
MVLGLHDLMNGSMLMLLMYKPKMTAFNMLHSLKIIIQKHYLGFKTISERPGSGFIRDLFAETFKEHGLLDETNPINILSDGGSENKGSLLEWVNQIEAPPAVRKLTARTEEFPQSNSMAESTHSIYKSEFLQGKHSVDKEDHLKNITAFFNYYNDNRFPFEFYGLTPMEVLKGETPDKAKFKEHIENAHKERLKENREFNGCPMVCS